MINPDPNQVHAFHPGPTGRCTYGDAFPCGRGKDADIHEGEIVPLLADDEVLDDRPTLAPTDRVAPSLDLLEPRSPHRPRWAELPIPSKIVIVAVTAGAASVFLSACIAACAVILRAGGVIG